MSSRMTSFSSIGKASFLRGSGTGCVIWNLPMGCSLRRWLLSPCLLVTQFRMVKTDQLVKGKNGSTMHRREPAYGSSPKEAIQLNLRLLADSRP